MTTPTNQELEQVASELEADLASLYYKANSQKFDYHPAVATADAITLILSALKQVQPTKGLSVGKSMVEVLVDSIAVSPQERVSADAQNVSTDVREASEDSSDGSHYNFWMFGRGTRCGICYWALYDGDWCMNKDCVMWQKSVQDNRIYLTNEEAQILIDRRVPPPATTPANP